MARVVYDVVGLADQDLNVLRTTELSKSGLYMENTRFLLDCSSKKFKNIFNDLLFYDDILRYINEKNINIELEEFQNFKKNFSSIFVMFRDKYPDLANKLAKKYKSTYKQCYGISFQVQDSFVDHDYNEINFYCKSDNKETFVKKYALVPEVSERVFDICTYRIDETPIHEAIITLIQAKCFYLSYLDIYKTDNNAVDYLNSLSNCLKMLKKRFPDEYKACASTIDYHVQPADNVYHNVDKFSLYIINKLYTEENIQALEKIRNILSNLDSDNPDNILVLDSFSGLLGNLGLIDEHNAFIKMRNKNEDTFIVSRLLFHFYSFYSTKKYQDMLHNLGGDQRTLTD